MMLVRREEIQEAAQDFARKVGIEPQNVFINLFVSEKEIDELKGFAQYVPDGTVKASKYDSGGVNGCYVSFIPMQEK